MVLIHQVLCLLRLVLQLASQLCVLDDCEFSCANQRTLILVQHFGFNSSDLEQHFLPEHFDFIYFSRFNSFLYIFLSGFLFVQ